MILARLRKTILFCLALAGGLLVFVTCTPVLEWTARKLSGSWNDSAGEVLIVLTADALDDGTIGVGSYWRGVYTVRAWREHPFRQIIVSGETRVSEPLRSFIVSQGVPADVVVIERRSTSTRENALFTCDMLRDRPGKNVLLTSDYHMFRAWRSFRKAGCETIPCPFPDVLKRKNQIMNRWPLFGDLMGEAAKIVYYRARGWI